jgi:hypothetical protein
LEDVGPCRQSCPGPGTVVVQALPMQTHGFGSTIVVHA